MGRPRRRSHNHKSPTCPRSPQYMCFAFEPNSAPATPFFDEFERSPERKLPVRCRERRRLPSVAIPPLGVCMCWSCNTAFGKTAGCFFFRRTACTRLLGGLTLRSSQSHVRNVLSRFLYRRKTCDTDGQQDPMQPVGIVNHTEDFRDPKIHLDSSG